MATKRDGRLVARVILSLVLSPWELVDAEVEAEATEDVRDVELSADAVVDVELEVTELKIQITLLVSLLSG